jgi:hypothetical protein
VRRALECSEMKVGEVESERVKVEGWRSIYTPASKTRCWLVKFRRLRRIFRRLRTTPPETLEICGDSAHLWTPNIPQNNPYLETPEKLLETPNFFVEKHSKDIPSVMWSAKVSLIDLLDHLEHLILHKASKFHVPLYSTAFLYSILKYKQIKSSWFFAAFISFLVIILFHL